MPLVFFDGFDRYSANIQLYSRYTPFYMYADSIGRFGSSGAKSASYTFSPLVTFQSQAVRILISFYVEFNYYNPSPGIISLYDGATTQVGVGYNNAGFFSINRNNSTSTSIGLSTKRFKLHTWNTIEWYVVITNSTGVNQCVLWLNGEEVCNLVGVDTQQTANSFATGVSIGTGLNNLNTYFDDLAIWTEEVTNSPIFYGDLKVQTLYPNGNGNYSQFVGSDLNSVNNFEMVDETKINAADYVGSGTVGNKDSYTITDLAAGTANIISAQISANVLKTDAAVRTGKTFIRLDGVDYEQPEFFAAASATDAVDMMHTNPATGSAWQASEVNAAEIGIKVQS